MSEVYFVVLLYYILFFIDELQTTDYVLSQFVGLSVCDGNGNSPLDFVGVLNSDSVIFHALSMCEI